MAPRTAPADTPKARPPPADAPQQPAAASLASRFSDEIWLRTFAQLEYYALNKVQRVCKKFQRLVQDKSLDGTLFRRGPLPGKLQVGTSFALHPHIASTHVLQRSRWLMAHADKAHKAAKTGRTPECTLWHYGALDDLATSPASTRIKVLCAPEFYEPLVGRESKLTHALVTKPGGVTVGDVFVALGTWFGARAPKAVTEELDYDSVTRKRSVLNEEMSEECFWQGWQDPVVRADEGKRPVLSVYLEAIPYGH